MRSFEGLVKGKGNDGILQPCETDDRELLQYEMEHEILFTILAL